MRRLRRRRLAAPLLVLNVLVVAVTAIIATLGWRYRIFQDMDILGLQPSVIVALRVSIVAALVFYYNFSFMRGASLTPSTAIFFINFVFFGAFDWMGFVNAQPDSLLIPNLTCLMRLFVGGVVFWIWIEDQLEDSLTSASAHPQPGQ